MVFLPCETDCIYNMVSPLWKLQISILFSLCLCKIFIKFWYVLHIFLINKNLFRLVGMILDLLARLKYPASENNLSDGTEVAGVPNKALIALNKQGNSNLRPFHHLLHPQQHSKFYVVQYIQWQRCTYYGFCQFYIQLLAPKWLMAYSARQRWLWWGARRPAG